MRKIVVLSVLSLVLGGLPQTRASILFLDDFNSYTTGNLVGQGLWGAHSGLGSVPVQVSGGAITLNQGSGSREDVNSPVGATMGAGDTWFYSFDLTVTGNTNIVYFAHFLQGTTTFDGRLYIAPANTPGFSLGLGSGSSSFTTSWASTLSFGTDYRVVVGYDYTSGDSTLWVNPVSQASTSITFDGTFSDAVTAIAFRQSTGNSTEVIDNLVVATSFGEALTGVSVPEPSTFALAIGGGLVCLVALRRKV